MAATQVWMDVHWQVGIVELDCGTDIQVPPHSHVFINREEGEINDIGDGTMFIGLQRYQQNYNR
jgi:hypothetical protein